MLFALVPLLLVEDDISTKKLKSIKVFGHSYLVFFIYNLLTTWWIWNASPGGAAMAVFANSLLMSITFQLFHFIKKRVGRREGYLGLIFLWISFEYVHYYWDISWPWLNLGNAFAKVINNMGLGFNVSEANFTLIGMTGLMAGVLHAPLTAIFLIAEITGGYDLFVPLMLVAAISFAFTKYFISNSIYTVELAKRGELITHNKDKNVLMMMQIDKLIENNFKPIFPEMLLGEMLKDAVSKSTRNIFPVINKEKQFLGIVLLDDIRPIMFDTEMYKSITVETLMKAAPEIIFHNDSVAQIMQKFKESDAWNLPVVKNEKYIGFISKSKLLTAYRNKLIEVTS